MSAELQAQTDASINDAKQQVVNATNSLKPYQKFLDNDSVHWLFGGDGTLSFNAKGLTNWAAGGEDQLGINSVVNIFLNYKKGKRTFENYWTFAYGLLKTGKRKAVKSDDRLYYTSKLGHQMLPKLYYTASFIARTQFTPGYKYSGKDTIRISDFMAPIRMFLSVGLDYRPSNSFSFAMSPVMGKATYSNSDSENVLATAGLITVEKDENGADVNVPHQFRYEFGGGAQMSLNGNLFKNKISYSSQVDIFSNYMQKPENIDVFWTFQSKILLYKGISADVRFELQYDDDKKSKNDDGSLGGPKVQVKNYVGVGVFYQF
jgi:hypothetical protein